MSVSTQFSVQTESQWDLQSESTSMISFDMSQPSSPTSPSKSFKVGFVYSFEIDQNLVCNSNAFIFYICHNYHHPVKV